MVKKFRHQENRTKSSDSRRRPPREQWVFEPLDAVLAAIVLAIVIWLQWLTATLGG